MVAGLVAGVLLIGALVLVVSTYPTSTPELTGVDRVVPSAAPLAASPVVVSPSTSAVAAPIPNPCAGVSQFRQVLETTAPGFAARRGITEFSMKGCSRGVALAQGVIPEQDSLFVALLPRSAGRHVVDSWAPGTACDEVRGLPASLSSMFCASAEPTPDPGTPPTSGCAAGTTICPAGYREGVVSAANPYGCNFDAISADNPCMWRYDNQMPGGPGRPTPETKAQSWAVCHLSGYREFC